MFIAGIVSRCPVGAGPSTAAHAQQILRRSTRANRPTSLKTFAIEAIHIPVYRIYTIVLVTGVAIRQNIRQKLWEKHEVPLTHFCSIHLDSISLTLLRCESTSGEASDEVNSALFTYACSCFAILLYIEYLLFASPLTRIWKFTSKKQINITFCNFTY